MGRMQRKYLLVRSKERYIKGLCRFSMRFGIVFGISTRDSRGRNHLERKQIGISKGVN